MELNKNKLLLCFLVLSLSLLMPNMKRVLGGCQGHPTHTPRDDVSCSDGCPSDWNGPCWYCAEPVCIEDNTCYYGAYCAIWINPITQVWHHFCNYDYQDPNRPSCGNYCASRTRYYNGSAECTEDNGWECSYSTQSVDCCGDGDCSSDTCVNSCTRRNYFCSSWSCNHSDVDCASGDHCSGGSCTGGLCNDTNHCSGDTYYDGYTCNGSGNCNVDAGDIGCCTDSYCGSCGSGDCAGHYECDLGTHTCTSVCNTDGEDCEDCGTCSGGTCGSPDDSKCSSQPCGVEDCAGTQPGICQADLTCAYGNCSTDGDDCGNCGICSGGSCSGEGECSPGPDSSSCSCPSDTQNGIYYYDYPDYGDCSSLCACQTGTGTGEPCEPISVTCNLNIDGSNITVNQACTLDSGTTHIFQNGNLTIVTGGYIFMDDNSSLDLSNANLSVEGSGYIQMNQGTSVLFDPGRQISVDEDDSYILKSAGGTEIRKE